MHARKKFKKDIEMGINMQNIKDFAPKVDNLEYLPTEILSDIFANVDDYDLVQLAQTSYRFERIAQKAVEQRVIVMTNLNSNVESREKCASIVRRFGDHMRAVELRSYGQRIQHNDWLIVLLKQKAKQIQWFHFNGCAIMGSVDGYLENMNLTHLTFQFCTLNTPMTQSALRNLRHLECIGTSKPFNEAECLQLIRNNPQLEHLIIDQFDRNIDPGNIFTCASENLKHLKNLHIISTLSPLRIPLQLSMATQNLRSLGLSINNNSAKLMNFLRSRCEHIETMRLVHLDNHIEDKIIDAIQAFTKIKQLWLQAHKLTEDSCMKLVNGLRLPNLTFLKIQLHDFWPNSLDYVLSFIRENQKLQHIVVQSFNNENIHSDFYQKFLEITQNRPSDVTIQFIDGNNGSEITVNRNAVVQRGILLYWPAVFQNRTNTHIFDLIDAERLAENQAKTPFEHILDYLDMNELYALHQISSKCRRLIQKNVQARFHEVGLELLAKEGEIQNDAIRAFGRYIVNIKISLKYESSPLWELINKHCPNITTMKLINYATEMAYFEDDEDVICVSIVNNLFNFPKLQKFVYWAVNLERFDISKLTSCTHLTTLICYGDIRIINHRPRPGDFENLKTVQFYEISSGVYAFINSLDISVRRNISFEEI